MRDEWYGDGRDLIKWSVLAQLADHYHADRILQIAFLRPSIYPSIVVGSLGVYESHRAVIDHFRNVTRIQDIQGCAKVRLFDLSFENREAYLRSLIDFISAHSHEKCVVFLDPDTGLEPAQPDFRHVLASEVSDVWSAIKNQDLLAFYQHKTNRAGQPWIQKKRKQLADAIGVAEASVQVASSAFRGVQDKEVDVVLYFAEKA